MFQRENLVPFNIQISNIEAVEVFGGGGDDFFETGDLAVTGVTELFFDGGDGSDTVSTQANEGAGIGGVRRGWGRLFLWWEWG